MDNRDGSEKYPTDEDARRQQQAREAQKSTGGAAMDVSGRAGRESSRQLLGRRIREAEHRVVYLQALLDSLPSVLPPLADEALWQMLVGMR